MAIENRIIVRKTGLISVIHKHSARSAFLPADSVAQIKGIVLRLDHRITDRCPWNIKPSGYIRICLPQAVKINHQNPLQIHGFCILTICIFTRNPDEIRNTANITGNKI